MSPALRLNGFRLGLLLAALAAGTGEAAFGEIRASGKNGLRTEVNGVRGGGCNKGVCRIGGGTNAGKNKFHRFKDFDTRGAIERVEFDTGGKHNLVVGVTSANGTWINKMVALSSKANLFFLSPGGIHLGKGAGFINVPKLSLSTADQLRFAEGTFDVFHSTPESVAAFTTNPLPGVFGMRRSEMDKGVVLEAGQLPGIHLNGINNIDFREGKVETVLEKLRADGIEIDILVIDPPRKGLSESVVETVLKIGPDRLIYVSCNPSTLARDLKKLESGRLNSDDGEEKVDESGYKTVRVTPIDMFPQTYHVESVACLVRKNSDGSIRNMEKV